VVTVRAWLRHAVNGAARREVIKKVVFLAEEGGRERVEGAWCETFR